MIARSAWIATLKEDKAELYKRLHDDLPAAIAAELADKGFVRLDIYRLGSTVVMTWEVDSERVVPNRLVREAAEREWQRITGDCFAERWQPAELVFRLEDHAHKASQANG